MAAIGYFALMKMDGKPAGLTLWQLFGTTNQVLAGLGLLTVSVFLYKARVPVVCVHVDAHGVHDGHDDQCNALQAA